MILIIRTRTYYTTQIMFTYGGYIHFHIVERDKVIFSSIADVILIEKFDSVNTHLKLGKMRAVKHHTNITAFYEGMNNVGKHEILTIGGWLIRFENYRRV